MRALVAVVASFFTCASFAAGWALSYSVDSFKEAQQVVQQHPQKHILVYYANAGR